MTRRRFLPVGREQLDRRASNFMPAEHVALYEACVLRKDFADGIAVDEAMLKMFYLLEQGGKYIQYVKYGVELAGSQAGRRALPPGLTRQSANGSAASTKRSKRAFGTCGSLMNKHSFLG